MAGNLITDTPLKRGNSRVFLIENQAGPTHVPIFLSFGMAGSFEQPLGDVSRIEVPSSNQYGQYSVAGEIPGAVENATLPITYQSQFAISRLWQVSKRRCPYDLQVHFGDCEDPSDFDKGWKLILAMERARSTTFKTDDLGSLISGDEDKVTEEMDASALRAYYIGQMSFAKRAESDVTSAIVAIAVCDKPNCGECGSSSDGCQVVLSVSDPAGSSPGLLPEVIYTADGYTSSNFRMITTFAVGDNPDDATCVGSYFVVVSADSGGMHVAVKDDILNAAETWQLITNGFVALKGPQAIVSVSSRETWIVGKGGYIYFSSSPTDGVSVQDAGVATTQDLNDIDAINSRYLVAVGAANAVVYTTNGGDSWSSVTGPAPATVLNTVAMRSASEWWVGSAAGKMYYTLDKGQHWTEKTFNGSGSGSLKRIVWASDTVGFAIHNTGTKGRILRTVSGGNSWYVMPESVSEVLPANVQLNALAVCLEEVNVLYAGGLATGSADGVIIKGTPSAIST
jgi:photosystem II stability/assembly factor-like uncharacterized protein